MMKNGSFFWEVSESPYVSEFLLENKQFGYKNPVYLIDQFEGKRPAIINSEFLIRGNIQFKMFATSLLDSNVLDQMDKFVQKGQVTDGLSGFLNFLVERKWDSSALFYYLEHFSKSSIDDFKHNAIRRTESLLKIHSMDEPLFLRTGKITPDNQALEHYLISTGSKNLYEVAEKRVEGFIKNYNKSELVSMLEVTEIALIKMVLIRKTEMKKSSQIAQYNEFMRFLKIDLGIMLAREAHLAIHYFCDNAGRLLGIQSNMSKDKAKSIIKSTAWDIYLLRMPEVMFTESPTEVCISYVSTHEKQLQALAKLYSIERIECFYQSGITPVVGFNMAGIPEGLRAQIEDELYYDNAKNVKSVPTGLKQALYKELDRFCAK